MNFIYKTFEIDAFERLLETVHNDFPNLGFSFELIREGFEIDTFLRNRFGKPADTFVGVEVKINGNEEVYKAKLSKNFKQNIRTAQNRMNKDKYNYAANSTIGIISDEKINVLNRIYKNRLITIRARNKPANIIKKAYWFLFYGLLDHNRNIINVVENNMKENKNSFLLDVKIEGHEVGYLFGLRDHYAIRIIRNCFDEQYKWYSPMTRACYELIVNENRKKSNSVMSIDFTRGDEEYKFKLGGKQYNLNTYCFKY